MRGGTIIPLVAGLALAACSAEAEEASEAEVTETAEAAVMVSTIEATQLEALMKDGNIRLIDVRTDEEVAEGAIPGAEHIALDEFDPAKLDLSDGREVVTYCRSGRRSGIAAERLSKFTKKPTRHLEGGITAWEKAKLPLAY